MEKNVIICGYGIPRDIFKDEHYSFYLKTFFNALYEDWVKNKGTYHLIFSGGKTDLFKPYDRIEAEEMSRFFSSLMERPFVSNVQQYWEISLEPQAISTLENLIFARELIQSKRGSASNVTIFCEFTRRERIQKIASHIFSDTLDVDVRPVDFDVSMNRYLDKDMLAKKEALVLKNALWALESEENLRKHHQLFEERLSVLRSRDDGHTPEALREWWQDKLENLSTSN